MVTRKLGLLLSVCLLASNSGYCKLPEKIYQQPDNVLVDFYAYRHVAVVHFDVPENTVSAGFKFVVKEEKTGGIGSCDPRSVMIHLKSGSLPLVTPDNSKIEAKLLEDRRRSYTLAEILSNRDEHIITIDAPIPGDWYAIAYRTWHDPNDNKIMQQGLTVSCNTILDAELFIEKPDKLLPAGDGSAMTTHLTTNSSTALMQFRVPQDAGDTSLSIKSSCADQCTITLDVTAGDHLLRRNISTSDASFALRSHPGLIHNVILRLITGTLSTVTVTMKYDTVPSDALAKPKLTKKSFPEFFLFDYDHLTENSTKSVPMNLTAGTLNVLRFKVGKIYDIGGTLSVGLKIADSEASRKMVLVGCVTYGYYTNITSTGNCIRPNAISSADIFVANSSDPGFVHVPYPEPGPWYLTTKALCIKDNEICECAELCAKNVTECEGCDCTYECNAQIETSIASSPCIDGACNSHGRCVNYMSGGFVFSACHCNGGYRGFDCADDAYIPSKTVVLVKLLTLTTSNLAFIGAIVIAIKREYYTESIVYAAVMFFSTFYHACEGGDEVHSFCLLKLNVLQFCDFFNALLSIWVTLVAMASFGPKATSFCQMLGVVILAIGAEMDRSALWVFLLPTVSGILLVMSSWAIKCRQKGSLQYPARMYRLVFLPLGLLVVVTGLICYAFLQNQGNYYLIHSVWHVCVAFGVMLLLPKKEYME